MTHGKNDATQQSGNATSGERQAWVSFVSHPDNGRTDYAATALGNACEDTAERAWRALCNVGRTDSASRKIFKRAERAADHPDFVGTIYDALATQLERCVQRNGHVRLTVGATDYGVAERTLPANPPHDALRQNVQRCIAEGAPVLTEQAPEPDDTHLLRRVLFDGHMLATWDTGTRDGMGKCVLRYRLFDPEGRIVFDGSDYAVGMATCIDSDESLRCLLGFLTLEPGDVESEYFDKYTPAQIAWRNEHAESLWEWTSEEGPEEGSEPLGFVDVDWIREACERGTEAAEAAASWATDGNVSADEYRKTLAMIDAGEDAEDRLPARPNLSGEWADDPSPLTLARSILCIPDVAPNVVDTLADAWEEAVSERFEQACAENLRAAIGEG